MKLSIQYKLLIVVITGITIYSCVKKPTYPSEPVIAYKNFLRYGNPSDPDSVELVVSFTDNEGDIGLDQSDTNGIFKNGNFFMVYFYWDTTGVDHWMPYDSIPWTPQMDTLNFFYRVPPALSPGEKSQPMKGLIYVKQNPFINFFDKIKYEVYMYDNAKHISNRISTPAITFP